MHLTRCKFTQICLQRGFSPASSFFVENQKPLFLPTSKNWFWVCLLTCLLAFTAPRHHQLPACAATSILAGMWDWARKENSSRWKRALQSGELPWLYGRHRVSHTDDAFLMQWFTGWWVQPCDSVDTLTLHFGPDIWASVAEQLQWPWSWGNMEVGSLRWVLQYNNSYLSYLILKSANTPILDNAIDEFWKLRAWDASSLQMDLRGK